MILVNLFIHLSVIFKFVKSDISQLIASEAHNIEVMINSIEKRHAHKFYSGNLEAKLSDSFFSFSLQSYSNRGKTCFCFFKGKIPL